jgi:hypothetical protein
MTYGKEEKKRKKRNGMEWNKKKRHLSMSYCFEEFNSEFFFKTITKKK